MTDETGLMAFVCYVSLCIYLYLICKPMFSGLIKPCLMVQIKKWGGKGVSSKIQIMICMQQLNLFTHYWEKSWNLIIQSKSAKTLYSSSKIKLKSKDKTIYYNKGS